MAGVTDKSFRLVCKRPGAGYAVSEMATSDPRLWKMKKSLWRMGREGERDPTKPPLKATIENTRLQALKLPANVTPMRGIEVKC